MEPKKSTKTTIAAIATLVSALALAVVAVTTGESINVEAILTAIAAVATAFGLSKARDHDVSSKAAGVEK